MSRYPKPMARLIEELTRLPGIGPKTAQRLSFFLIGLSKEEAHSLASAIVEAKDKIAFCSQCFQLTESDPCSICADPRRDRTIICVVEEPRDVIAIERTKEFNGLYHVLHGAISPLEGIGPEQLRITELMAVGSSGREVLLATDPNVEGEATAMYLARVSAPGHTGDAWHMECPLGLTEYVDEVTLGKLWKGVESCSQ